MNFRLVILSFALVTAAFAEDCSQDEAKKSVEWACEQFKSGDEKTATKEVQKYRYCGKNYVWLQDKEVKMIMHPIKRKLDGKDLTGYKDKKGKAIFVEFDKTATANAAGGWVDYVWPKPGEESATPKISFVKKCTDNVVAGSGVWK